MSENTKFALGMLGIIFFIALLTECDNSVPSYDMIDCQVEYTPWGAECR